MVYSLYVMAPVGDERVSVQDGEFDTLASLARRLLDSELVDYVEVRRGKAPGPTPRQERAAEATRALLAWRENPRE